jgi:hypothetical protein
MTGPRVDGAQITADRITRWLLTRIRRVLGFGVMRASSPLRSASGDPIRARAWLKSAKIEERYSYSQEISLNAGVRVEDEPSGLIKLVLPYDGDKYFTRQAYRDVGRARDAGLIPADGAIVGFLALTDFEKTGLEESLGLNANYGSVPVRMRVPTPPPAGEKDELIADSGACVITQKYRPDLPKIVPASIDIEVYDPDAADISELQMARTEVIAEAPERQLDFELDMWLRIVVRMHLPRKQADGVEAKVNKVFMSWPTHTSLSYINLSTDAQAQLRYNPEQEHEGRKGGLEWSDVPMTLEESGPSDEQAYTASRSDDEIVTMTSGVMMLSISKPGELYKEEKLGGWVEVTVNRLLSGMDARLYDATGKLCSRRPGVELKSIARTEFSLPLYDAFARRRMSPYQWLYFDEVIPSQMRIDDIEMALKNRGFKVSKSPGPRAEDCRISATRAHGPDQLQLSLYVRGNRYKASRERSVQGGMTYKTLVDSGELRIYVYGSLKAESSPVVREINALRRALRERFDRLPAGR